MILDQPFLDTSAARYGHITICLFPPQLGRSISIRKHDTHCMPCITSAEVMATAIQLL